MGLHPSIVSDEVFHRANEVLAGRVRKMKFHEDKTDIYPLKGFLVCPVHGTSLTAYGCRNHMGNLYHYYICTKCKGGQRHKIETAHESIEEILSKISFHAGVVNVYRKTLEKIFDKDDHSRRDEITKTTNEIDRIHSRLVVLQNQFLDGQITPQDYHKMKERVEKDLTGLELRLKDFKMDKSPYKTYVYQTLPMLVNLVEYYRKSDGLTKKKLLSCIFSKKLTFENGRVATFEFTTPVQVLLSVYRVFEGSETKKEVKNDLLSCLAPLTVESCNLICEILV